jgi:hypothetical protein
MPWTISWGMSCGMPARAHQNPLTRPPVRRDQPVQLRQARAAVRACLEQPAESSTLRQRDRAIPTANGAPMRAARRPRIPAQRYESADSAAVTLCGHLCPTESVPRARGPWRQRASSTVLSARKHQLR